MRPAEAAMLDSCRDRPVVFYCYPDFGCEVDPVFSKTVTEMASALGLSDENYRPCRLIIDTTKGRYEVSHPLLTLCWNYVPLCGTTARTFAQAVRGEDVIITNVHVWLERHIPNYVPIAIEDGSWTEQGRMQENTDPGADVYHGCYISLPFIEHTENDRVWKVLGPKYGEIHLVDNMYGAGT